MHTLQVRNEFPGMKLLCFCVLPDSAEALVSWVGKVNQILIALSLQNIFAKKTNKMGQATGKNVRNGFLKQCRIV